MSKYIQRSPEWLQERKSKIGASDIAKILGISPFGSAYDLYLEKVGEKAPKEANAAMQRGTNLEPIALARYCEITGHFMMPLVIYGEGKYDFCMCSFDGIDFDHNKAVEIKIPGKETILKAKAGEVEEFYYCQCQFHMMLEPRLESEDFFVTNPENGDEIILNIKRDNVYIENMFLKAQDFMNLVRTKTPPPKTEKQIKKENIVVRTDQEFIDACKDEILLRTAKENVTEEHEVARQRVINLLNEKDSVCPEAGLQITWVESLGKVDNKKLYASYKITESYLDLFRAERRGAWTIKKVK